MEKTYLNKWTFNTFHILEDIFKQMDILHIPHTRRHILNKRTFNTFHILEDIFKQMGHLTHSTY